MKSSKIKSLIAVGLVISTISVGILGCENSAIKANNNIENTKKKEMSIEDMRNAWYDDLTGGEEIDKSNEVIKSKISGYVKKVDKHLESLNKTDKNKALWSEYEKYKENPAFITSMLNNIYDMALGYTLPNDKYFKNAELKENIIYSLEWINKNAYNSEIETYGNWWDWMIGIPARLNNITILMYDDLSKEQINAYMGGIQKNLPSIEPGSKNHTGANLADVCLNKLLQGVILEDEEKIKEASEDIISVFEYVDSGDGFYKDGSYVQHGIVAYTGSYGNVLIDKISNLMFLLENTEWRIKSENKSNIYKWITESFDPIIYKGYVMDMVRGRSISRHNGNGYFQAAGIIEGMIKVALSADEQTSNEIKSLVKQWGNEANEVLDFGSKFKSINVLNEYYKIMEDENIKSTNQEENHFALNMMDKTVHERAGYSLGIARSSNRISKYEFMNKENLTPWFQGDGMTYLYNDDLTQFSKDYWPTIDPYRMPGTTVDTREREKKVILPDFEPSDKEQDKVYYELTNSPWSGGSKIGKYGTAGMQISNKNDNLKANKSWFMFDDEIVCLGAGITNPDDYSTETIIENRKLNLEGNNKITINGEEIIKEKEGKKSFSDAKWAHLEGNTEKNGIGYYFPDKVQLNILRDFRKGSWRDINEGPTTPDDKVENTFATMYIDHGKKIENKNYSYVLLPNKSIEEMKLYEKNYEIEIIANNKDVQGVIHNKLKIESYNFFSNKEITSGRVTSNGQASVIMKESDSKEFEISISDPTFNREEVEIILDIAGSKVIEKDENIKEIEFKDGKVKIKVNTKDLKGQNVNLKIK